MATNRSRENDFHNFYKYELSVDDAECMAFLLRDYLIKGDLSLDVNESRRIQDFVFLLLRNGLSENETLNVLIESLYYIPRHDILYECSIEYNCYQDYKYGKWISSRRVLLFMLYNDFCEDDFKTSLMNITNKRLTLPHDSVLKNLNILLQCEDIFEEIISYFSSYGNSRTEQIIIDYKAFPKERLEMGKTLLLSISKSSLPGQENVLLAIEKGDEKSNPNFGFKDNGRVKIVNYNNNERYKYPESDPSKSLCLVFNISNYAIKPRKGSEKDINLIRKTFEKLHFTIQLFQDVTKDEMLSLAHSFADVDAKKAGAMFVCFILGHGTKDCVFDINEEKVNIRQFSLIFSARTCKCYMNKPKVFFIQACQGDRFHEGIPESNTGTPLLSQFHMLQAEQSHFTPKIQEYTQSDIIPEEADFIYGMATVPDYVSFRNTKKGSWYIRELCKRISDDVTKSDIINILIAVNHEVAKKNYRNACQLPSVMFTARKKCFLTEQI